MDSWVRDSRTSESHPMPPRHPTGIPCYRSRKGQSTTDLCPRCPDSIDTSDYLCGVEPLRIVHQHEPLIEEYLCSSSGCKAE